ncbi:PriCT-2 domain-containing protein [Vagococcus sp. DIV0080]|uniref:PriCT-2 domain-containing protein n=1 Tax=Candidatus Vagococcus giribetii TaxID=2230876 RepID=A0ABS3HW14_9ENTE|nr:PriCT-2 domain-containing protein [Vagococcus sp. DIV0080]
MDNKLDLTELLEHFDSSQLNYQEWIKVGMGLK